MAAEFEISKDKAGKFRFHLKAPNGEIIAASQGYETKESAENAIEAFKTHALAQRSETTAEPVRTELMADVDRKEAGAGEPSWLRKHQTVIVGGLILPLVVGLMLWGVAQAWKLYYPESADPRISDIQTTDQTPFQSATATVQVHNDGKASTDGCVIHWMAEASLGRGPRKIGTSRQFGLGPGEYRSVTFFGPKVSPTNLVLVATDTWAYVECLDLKSPDSAHRQVSMSRPFL
jgi:uncharacterized protein